MRARSPIVSFAAATACTLGCGARTGLDVEANAADAETETAADAPFDAAGCPPVPTTWTESVVGDGADSYAIARDDRCGVVVVWANASKSIDVATLDEKGEWVHSPLGVSGVVVSAKISGPMLHVLFNDGASLRYVYRNDGALGAVEHVDRQGLARGELALDAHGNVHAVYPAANGTSSVLHHAVRRGVPTWSIDQVDGRQSFEPSIALAPDGEVYVSYLYVANSEDHACVLRLLDGPGFDLPTVDPTYTSSEPCTVRVTRDGIVHLAFGAFGGPLPGPQMRHAYGALDALHFENVDLPTVDPTYTSSEPCTVRVTRDGIVHLAFGAFGPGPPPGPQMRHAYGALHALHFENVDVLASFGDDPGSADVDGAGALHVAYRSKDGALRVATLRPPAPPAIDTVTSEDSQGVLVVVDGAGVTNVVAYRKGRLVVARHGP